MIPISSCFIFVGMIVLMISYRIYQEDYVICLILSPMYFFLCTFCVILRRFHDYEDFLNRLEYGHYTMNAITTVTSIYCVYTVSILLFYNIVNWLLYLIEIDVLTTGIHLIIYFCSFAYFVIGIVFTIFFFYDLIDRTTIRTTYNFHKQLDKFEIPDLLDSTPAA